MISTCRPTAITFMPPGRGQHHETSEADSVKTTIAFVAFIIAWAILAPVLWRRNMPWAPVLLVAAALIAGGLVGTFPKFFELFAE